MSHAAQRTAFVFAGGGSLGAVQAGMLRELMHAGVSADLVLRSSVGAMNAAYFAGAAHAAGVNKLEEVWRGLRRHDVFPVTFRSVLGFMGGANLIDPSNLRKLIERNIPFANLEDAPIPVHVVATNLGGVAICLSSGPSRRSSPALRFPQLSRRFASANIISLTAQSGATRRFSMQPIWVPLVLSFFRPDLACALHEPPMGAIARALHAITLLIAHQMVRDLRELGGKVDVFTVPNLCPLNVSPYDFSRADQLIEQAAEHTRKWIEGGGLSRPEIPNSLLPHTH